MLLHLLISASRARLREGLLDPSMALLFRNAPFNLKDAPIDASASIHLTASLCLCGHGRDAFSSPLKSQAARRCPDGYSHWDLVILQSSAYQRLVCAGLGVRHRCTQALPRGLRSPLLLSEAAGAYSNAPWCSLRGLPGTLAHHEALTY